MGDDEMKMPALVTNKQVNDDEETTRKHKTASTRRSAAAGALSFHDIYDKSKPLIPPPLKVAQLYARALWDPTPTKTELQQKQLAYALGYPMGWRVERTVTYEPTSSSSSSTAAATTTTKGSEGLSSTKRAVISDRIHAMGGKKNQTLYTWLNHEAAQAAAAELEETGETQLGKTIGTYSSHLLPPKAKYNKGDVIQVLYEDKWWEATVTKRKRVGDEFLYSVRYQDEDATQDEVAEEDIKPAEDPAILAVELGFPDDWKATRKGARYFITAPSGDIYTSKKAALKYLKKLQGDDTKNKNKKKNDDGVDSTEDPPWRTEGHSLIGRRIMWSFEHRASATRRIKIEQEGTVIGYIDAKDKDRQGNPGFVSEKTGQPANLFRIKFSDDTSHPYAKFLLDVQDVEEYEILDRGLLPEVEPVAAAASGSSSSKKRKR